MALDIRFFQVSAAIIPTLLIAVAVTAKTFEAGEYPDEAGVRAHTTKGSERTPDQLKERLRLAEKAWWMHTSLLVLIFTAIVIPTVLDERAALAALVENRPTTGRLHWVYAGIYCELALLTVAAARALTKPIAQHATVGYQRVVGSALFAVIAIALTIALWHEV